MNTALLLALMLPLLAAALVVLTPLGAMRPYSDPGS
jgi:hypothetical protein